MWGERDKRVESDPSICQPQPFEHLKKLEFNYSTCHTATGLPQTSTVNIMDFRKYRE